MSRGGSASVTVDGTTGTTVPLEVQEALVEHSGKGITLAAAMVRFQPCPLFSLPLAYLVSLFLYCICLLLCSFRRWHAGSSTCTAVHCTKPSYESSIICISTSPASARSSPILLRRVNPKHQSSPLTPAVYLYHLGPSPHGK